MVEWSKKNRSILNLTQHMATKEQKKAGVVDLDEKTKIRIHKLLNFHHIPSVEELEINSQLLTEIARKKGYDYVMIGGAPYLMPSLVATLKKRGVTPLFSFSERESTEVEKDGEIIKTSVFKHKGFIEL